MCVCIRIRTITQFFPICTNEPICAAFTIESSSIITWSPIVMGKKMKGVGLSIVTSQ